jgi:DnaJ family protein C protein 7
MGTMNQQCIQVTPAVDSLCSECPSVNFLKVICWMPLFYSNNYSLRPFLIDSDKISKSVINFIVTQQVNVEDSPMVAKTENVRIVPTFKIYKDGVRVKEMICPTLQVLRYSVRHYAVSSS